MIVSVFLALEQHERSYRGQTPIQCAAGSARPTLEYAVADVPRRQGCFVGRHNLSIRSLLQGLGVEFHLLSTRKIQTGR